AGQVGVRVDRWVGRRRDAEGRPELHGLGHPDGEGARRASDLFDQLHLLPRARAHARCWTRGRAGAAEAVVGTADAVVAEGAGSALDGGAAVGDVEPGRRVTVARFSAVRTAKADVRLEGAVLGRALIHRRAEDAGGARQGRGAGRERVQADRDVADELRAEAAGVVGAGVAGIAVVGGAEALLHAGGGG